MIPNLGLGASVLPILECFKVLKVFSIIQILDSLKWTVIQLFPISIMWIVMFLSASLIYFIEGIKLRFIRNPEAGTPTIFTGPKEEPRDDNDYNPQLTKKGDLITFTFNCIYVFLMNGGLKVLSCLRNSLHLSYLQDLRGWFW